MIYQEKFLYFQEALSGGSSDAVGADDVAMYSLSSFLGFDTQAADTNATTLNMRFKPMKRSGLVTDEGAVAEDVDVIVLTVTANKQKSVMQAITDKINEPISRDKAFLVVADVAGSEFIHPDITSAVVTLRAATA